ncbi:UNVERIFIED_CONTAM: hypothetical protein PYX00_004837 [Menopon gallinae]|uniref:Sodium-coupled monocarboxylate transporter 1 n=1 Tax=Menopon gallinae TaxID=328185 RepID=A0AAW2I5Y2_9NEOP
MVRNTESLVYDYIVFLVFIGVSLFVPFYTRLVEPKENTKANYVFAVASKVSMAAMLLSFARGTLGVRSFLGYPSELYYYGTGMYETLYGAILAYPIVSYFFVPVYYSLGITSVYQYLDLRFKSQTVRCIASGTYLIRNVLTLGVTIFTPCVALKTVVGFPYWASIIGITVISIVCAVVGGLKAAILADVIQGLIMIACSLAIIIQGIIDTDGVDYIVRTNYEHGRLKFFNFDMDPTIRVATVSALFGQLFMSLSIFGCQQNFVQRICSMKSMKIVRRTLWTNIPVIAVLFTLSWVAGMVIFADYVDCDPLKLGYISKIDEIVPFYVEDKFMHIPGLLGLFMASLFNGALSLSVSNLNSMATVMWEDFLSKIPCFRKFTDKQQLCVIKLMGVVLGTITMGVAFGVALLSGVIDSSQLMTSATSGPLLGVFVLAMFFPGCNWKGAASGMIVSHILTLWVTFGSRTIDRNPNPLLPLSTAGCNNESFNEHIFPMYETIPNALHGGVEWVNKSEHSFYTHDSGSSSESRDLLTNLYSITYMYYSLIGCGICVVIGIVVSLMTGTGEGDVYDEKLIHPLALKVSKLLPGKPRKYLKDTIFTKNSMITKLPEIRVTKPEKIRPKPDEFVSGYANGVSITGKYQKNMTLAPMEPLETISGRIQER